MTDRVDSDAPLPLSGGPTIGREAEVDRTATAVLRGRSRLVTLTGPGGVGKSRLAVEVARRVADRLADGVVFVPLAGVGDPAAVPVVAAGALQVGGSSDEPPLTALGRAVGDRELLVVFDNFEHVLAAAPVVATLLGACPRVRVLVTSQRPLGIEGERCIEVGPLAVPPPVTGPVTDDEVERLGQVAAVALFLARAATDGPARLTADTAALVAAACRRLGGSPLAIELAAPRTRVVSLAELVDRLGEDPLSVLATGTPGGDDRHRSLRATIGWAHDLLSRRDQEVLAQVSVFEHGFSFAAAAQVVAAPPTDVLDALDALVDAHLVVSRPTVDGAPRLTMPMTVRDVARERLRARGRYEEVHARLVRHVLSEGETTAARAETADEQAALDAVEVELDQVRAVLAHLRGPDPASALRLATALGPFWLHRGHLGEGRSHLAPALDPDVVAGLDPGVVARAQAWEARLAADQGVVGPHEGAGAMLAQLERGLAWARAAGTVDDQLRHLDFLSHVLVLHHDDVGPAAAITDQGIDLARRHGALWWLAQLVQRAAVIARLRGDLDEAAPLAAEAWTLARELRADRLVLHAGLTVVQLPPDERVVDPPDLAALLDLATGLHDRRLEATVAMSLGIEAMLADQASAAAGHFAMATRTSWATGYWHAIGFSLMCTTAFAAVRQRPEVCARLHGVVREVVPDLRRGMPPAYFDLYGVLVAEAEGAIGTERFDRLASDAAALGWDHAVAVALSFLGEVGADEPPGPPAVVPGVEALTRREREVLACIVEGSTNKEIARQLAIRPKTVMHHTVSIYRKLGAKGRAEAAAMGQRLGLTPR